MFLDLKKAFGFLLIIESNSQRVLAIQTVLTYCLFFRPYLENRVHRVLRLGAYSSVGIVQIITMYHMGQSLEFTLLYLY